jgi:hypothetical protein
VHVLHEAIYIDGGVTPMYRLLVDRPNMGRLRVVLRDMSILLWTRPMSSKSCMKSMEVSSDFRLWNYMHLRIGGWWQRECHVWWYGVRV